MTSPSSSVRKPALLLDALAGRLKTMPLRVVDTSSESLVNALQKHPRTWPQIRPSQPVAGGALVVNHQHKLDPSQRSAQVYGRPEFVESLAVPVIASRRLF